MNIKIQNWLINKLIRMIIDIFNGSIIKIYNIYIIIKIYPQNKKISLKYR